MSRQRLTLRDRLGLLCALAVAGCAVTKIDVDVYKGPLANQEQVQLQQFAVMAIGAKPLLIQLRNNLESLLRPPPPSPEALSEKQEQTPFLPDYSFRSDDARRVNAVLGLYEDKAPLGLKTTAARGWQALREYASNNVILMRTEDSKLWEDIETKMSASAPSLLRDVYAVFFDIGERRRLQEKSKEYKDRFKNVYDRTLNIYEALIVTKSNELMSTNEPESLDNAKIYKTGEPEDTSPNALYEKLTDEKLVQAHAKLLFDDPEGEAAHYFVQNVVDISNAYLNARVALQDVWEIAINGIIDLNTLEDREISREELVDRNAKLAEVIGLLTQHQYLSAYLCAGGDAGLKTTLEPFTRKPGLWGRAIFVYRDGDYEDARLALIAALRSKPAEVARALKSAHENIPATYPPELGCRAMEEMKDASGSKRKKFGLVRAPLPTQEFARTLQQTAVEAAFRGATEAASAGLERGRLPEGLETLIDRTLDVAARPGIEQDNAELVEARNVLKDALVQFAEKLLFIANNKELIREDSQAGAPDPLGVRRKKIDSYVLVLQAIGNSLLIQADELQHRNEHRDKLEDLAPAQYEALRLALSRGAEAYIADLLRDLEREKNEAAKLVVTATDENAAAVKAAAAAKKEQVALKEGMDAAAAQLATSMDAYNKLKKSYDEIAAAHDVVTRTGAGALPDAIVKDGSASVRKVIDDIIKHLGQYTPAVVREHSDPSATERAIAYFKLAAPETSATDQARTEAFKLVVSMVRRNLQDEAAPALAAVEASLNKAKTAVEGIARDLAKLQNEERVALENVTATAAKIARAKNAQAQIAAALAFVSQQRSAVRARVEAASVSGPPPQALDVLMAVLAEEQAKAPDDRTKEQLSLAEAVLAKRTLPPGAYSLDLSKLRPGEDAQEVLDRLIVTLQQEHVFAVAESGADSPQAQALNDAIKAAYDHRSGMAYIRPASVYLRSSYAATSLQDESGVTSWENLLQESTGRALPLFSESVSNPGSLDGKERQRINAEIDKQFWQNINSIRVSGAGQTNYVMAKDPVGNWYVKSYSSDPKEIIKAAKSLALFNLGAANQLDLLSRVPAVEAAANGATPGSGAAAGEELTETETKSALQRLLDKHKEKYDAQTKADYESIFGLDETLSKRIPDAWAANQLLEGATDSLKLKLDGAIVALAEELDKLKDAKDEDKGSAILTALNAVRRFNSGLIGKIASDSAAITDPKARTAAADDATRVTRDVLTDLIQRRQEAVRAYEDSIVFIGDATQP